MRFTRIKTNLSLPILLSTILFMAWTTSMFAQRTSLSGPTTTPMLTYEDNFIFSGSNRNIEVFKAKDFDTSDNRRVYYVKPIWVFKELDQPLDDDTPAFVTTKNAQSYQGRNKFQLTLEAYLIDEQFIDYAKQFLEEKNNPNGLPLTNDSKNSLVTKYAENAFNAWKANNQTTFDATQVTQSINNDRVIQDLRNNQSKIDVFKWNTRSCGIVAEHSFGKKTTDYDFDDDHENDISSSNFIEFTVEFDSISEYQDFIALMKAGFVTFNFEYTYYGEGYEKETAEILNMSVSMSDVMDRILKSNETPAIQSLYDAQRLGRIGITQDQRLAVQTDTLISISRITLVDREKKIHVATDNAKTFELLDGFFERKTLECSKYDELDKDQRTLLNQFIAPRIVHTILTLDDKNEVWKEHSKLYEDWKKSYWDRNSTQYVSDDDGGIKLSPALIAAIAAAIMTDGASEAAGGIAMAGAASSQSGSSQNQGTITDKDIKEFFERNEIRNLLKEHGVSNCYYNETGKAIVPMQIEVYHARTNWENTKINLRDIAYSSEKGLLKIIESKVNPKRSTLKNFKNDLTAKIADLKHPEKRQMEAIVNECKSKYDILVQTEKDRIENERIRREAQARLERIKNNIMRAASNQSMHSYGIEAQHEVWGTTGAATITGEPTITVVNKTPVYTGPLKVNVPFESAKTDWVRKDGMGGTKHTRNEYPPNVVKAEIIFNVTASSVDYVSHSITGLNVSNESNLFRLVFPREKGKDGNGGILPGIKANAKP